MPKKSRRDRRKAANKPEVFSAGSKDGTLVGRIYDDSTVEELEDILRKRNSWRNEDLRDMAGKYFVRGRCDLAECVIRKVVASEDSLHSEGHYMDLRNLALALKGQDKLYEAADFWRQATDAASASGMNHGPVAKFEDKLATPRAIRVEYGQLLIETGEMDLGLAQFDTAAEMDPQNPDAYYSRGLALQFKGEISQAASQYEVALHLVEKEDTLPGSLRQARERLAELRREHKSMLVDLPEADRLAAAGKHEESVTLLRATISNSDCQGAARLRAQSALGCALFTAGDFDGVKNIISDTINEGLARADAEREADLHVLLGKAMVAGADRRKRFAAEETVEKEDEVPHPMQPLERENAEIEFCRAIELDYDNPHAHVELAVIYLAETEDFVSADFEFKEVLCCCGWPGLDEDADDPLVVRASRGLKLTCDLLRGFREARASCDVPAHYICPLSHEILIHPVVAADGIRYEAWHLRRWLALDPEQRSPMTLVPLEPPSLHVDMALKAEIGDYIKCYKMRSTLRAPASASRIV